MVHLIKDSSRDGPKVGKTQYRTEFPERMVRCMICGRPYKPLTAEEAMQRWKEAPGESLATVYCPACWEIVKSRR